MAIVIVPIFTDTIDTSAQAAAELVFHNIIPALRHRICGHRYLQVADRQIAVDTAICLSATSVY